jgi:hypothetical protein
MPWYTRRVADCSRWSSLTGALATCALGALGPLAAGCGGEKKDGTEERRTPLTYADGAMVDAPPDEIGDGWISSDAAASESGSADAGPMCPGELGGELDTFIGAGKDIQIDQDSNSDVVGANANLVPGTDPADSPPGPSFNLPAALTTPATYIDWQDLGGSLANHQLLDVFAAKDPSAFPGNSSCVGAANNPAKDELLYVGLANNNDFVYTNVLRASSLGDMGYTWLFTKEKPKCAASGRCDNLLTYDITAGDVLLFGHFRTGTAKLLAAYKAQINSPGTLATDAISWGTSSLWGTADPTAVSAVAVNTDLTFAGAWGNLGVKSPKTGADGQPALEDHIFAEGAVRTSTFGSNGVCGQNYWVTVISKSSGNTSDGADVKDFIGPKKVNFGSISVVANVRPNCDGTVDLQATLSGTSGSVSCKWYDGDPTVEANKIFESPTCDTIHGVSLPEGSHSITVKVSDAGDGGTGCSVTSAPAVVDTHPAPTVVVALTPACTATNNLHYAVTSSTGVGTKTFSWTLTNSVSTPGLPVPTGTSGDVTVSPVGPAIIYTASVEMTDSRGCKATSTPATATPLGPITLTLTPPTVSRVCSATAPQTSIDDGVTFSANVTGGDGSYTYTWEVETCTDPSNPATCTKNNNGCGTGAATCKIDPVDADNPDQGTCALEKIKVSVDDGSAICGAKTAGPLTYTKTTTVTVL